MLRLHAALLCLATAGLASATCAHASGYKQIYAFTGANGDGFYPASGLINVGGVLYGTTYGGGDGPGTVFSLNPKSGSEKVIYAFHGTGDGQSPQAALINVNGTLFGTAFSGGANNHGAVFSVNPQTGAEKIVYSFLPSNDGGNPLSSLVNVAGTLYGTTLWGGDATNCGPGCGTVFSINPSTGAEKVLYEFKGGNDGAYPLAGLIYVGGKLYGTTEYGGTGYGTVFSVNPKTGAEKITYAFQASPDANYPNAGLINVGGTLFGTTYGGGGGYYHQGTVFSLAPKTGAEKVLYSFVGGEKDGVGPADSLLSVDGTLYGTTTGGGVPNCTNACGVVFSVNPKTLAEQVLYFFQGNSDGGTPLANLIKVGNTLYGTTNHGGDTTCNVEGCGTVFAIKP